MFCNFCKKFENSKWRDNFFLKIGIAILQRYLVGQKFHRNCTILHGFRHISIFVFCNFCEKFENSKWPPFLARQKCFENWDGYSAEIPCESNILSKSLYLAQFLRYKHFCFAIFVKNSKIQNGRHFGRDKNFLKLRWLLCRDTLWVKNCSI